MTVHPAPVVPRWMVQPAPVVPRITSQPAPVVPREEEEFWLLLEGILIFDLVGISRVDCYYVCCDKIIGLQMSVVLRHKNSRYEGARDIYIPLG
jgi:hypothetical protein